MPQLDAIQVYRREMVCVGCGKEAVTENEAVTSSPGAREVGGGFGAAVYSKEGVRVRGREASWCPDDIHILVRRDRQ